MLNAAGSEGFHKLLLFALDTNEAGKALYRSVGFREVGIFEKQAMLEGRWIDVIIMEKLLLREP